MADKKLKTKKRGPKLSPLDEFPKTMYIWLWHEWNQRERNHDGTTSNLAGEKLGEALDSVLDVVTVGVYELKEIREVSAEIKTEVMDES